MDREARLKGLLAEMEMQRTVLLAGADRLHHSLVPMVASRLLRFRPVWLGTFSILMTLWRRSRKKARS